MPPSLPTAAPSEFALASLRISFVRFELESPKQSEFAGENRKRRGSRLSCLGNRARWLNFRSIKCEFVTDALRHRVERHQKLSPLREGDKPMPGRAIPDNPLAVPNHADEKADRRSDRGIDQGRDSDRRGLQVSGARSTNRSVQPAFRRP